ncbi:MAG: hypothetical protein LN588_05735 [Rickettsia endosymbiont of Bryobia graminum]|nr:hypothetical protein [Rickettsia endosymbiont of Bryobia graminum]
MKSEKELPSVENYMTQIDDLVDEGQSVAALKLLFEVEKKYPNNSDLQILKGSIMLNINPTTAVKCFNLLMDKEPGNIANYLKISEILQNFWMHQKDIIATLESNKEIIETSLNKTEDLESKYKEFSNDGWQRIIDTQLRDHQDISERL